MRFQCQTQSRSTWACELKCMVCNANPRVTSHAPRERVSWNYHFITLALYHASHAPRERVSWNVSCVLSMFETPSHAPRERVSWNTRCANYSKNSNVTLHVSVWVEIDRWSVSNCHFQSRSTWACELKWPHGRISRYSQRGHAPRERVSWNYKYYFRQRITKCHAPRERVSWNPSLYQCKVIFVSRSTWACELKFISLLPFNGSMVSRSTWACELKLVGQPWFFPKLNVTLHVSVWVEIHATHLNKPQCQRHAPRERVSWNINF